WSTLLSFESMNDDDTETKAVSPLSLFVVAPRRRPMTQRGYGEVLRSASTALAAPTPHMPCTPPPGGVEAEQRYSPLAPVRYPFHRIVGRKTVWRNVPAPPLMSPPT